MSTEDEMLKEAVKRISDDLRKAFEGTFVVRNTCDFTTVTINIGDLKSVDCLHEWLEYVGFKECFFYCKKCDQKQS